MPSQVMTVQAKGQVTIDQRMREEAGIKPGDEVIWLKNREGRLELWKVEDLLDDADAVLVGLGDFLRQSKAGFNPRPLRGKGD